MCKNSPPWLLVYGVVSVGREHARSSPECEAVLWSSFRCYYIPQEEGWGQGCCLEAHMPSEQQYQTEVHYQDQMRPGNGGPF